MPLFDVRNYIYIYTIGTSLELPKRVWYMLCLLKIINVTYNLALMLIG